jgi:hypothetical protein
MRLAAAFAIVAIVGVAALSIRGPAMWLGSAFTPTPRAASPIVWTPEAIELDWPGPLRVETVASAGQVFRVDDYVDGVGDSGVAQPWMDIARVTSAPISLELAGGLLELTDPTLSWIAYGVVVDLDDDGQPDQRIGIDNSASDHREWIADLKTGETAVNQSGSYGAFGAFGTRIETWFPGGIASGPVLIVKREPAGFRFYAWSSVVSGDGIVATDFAPDVGWIETDR